MNRPARILVVDDEPNVRLMVRTALEFAGYDVAEAPDAGRAIDNARVILPDLMLLDLKLPGVSGLDALKGLREATMHKSPIIIFTAHGSVSDAVAALKLGAVDFIAKPLKADVLRRTVFNALSCSTTACGGSPFAGRMVDDHLASAKRALEARAFAEAETYLKRAVALDPNLGEAHRLLALLSACEPHEPALFGGLVDWFPSGRSHRCTP